MLQQYHSHPWHRESSSSLAPYLNLELLTNRENPLASSLLFESVFSSHMGIILYFCIIILAGHCYTSCALGQTFWTDGLELKTMLSFQSHI